MNRQPPDTTWLGGKGQHLRLCNWLFRRAREQSCLDTDILLVSTVVTSDPGELHISNLSNPYSSFETLHTRRGASQMRQVHKSDGSEMTGRQEGTADRGCMDCPEMFKARIYKNPQFPPSGASSCAVSSIFNQPSHPMAFTHVYRAIEITPLTVIPYKPKLQKPSNRNVHNPTSKLSISQPSSINAFQGIDLGKLSVEMLHDSSWLAKNAEDCEATAGNAVGPGDDPKSAPGMRSD